MPIIYSSLNHVLRAPLAAEIHSRPFLQLEAPELISHLAVFAESETAPERASTLTQQAMLAALCGHFGVAPPAPQAKYFYHDFGRFRLKWECHTEFATYTFASHPPTAADGGAPALADAFARMPVSQLPQEWLMGLKGQLIVAAHVVLDRSAGTPEAFALGLGRVFEGNILVGSEVLEGGELWTDFAIQADGFSRFVVRDVGMRAQQSGRLVQRVLEIETYRMMALIGLPRAQQAAPVLNDIENALAALADTMVDSDDSLQFRAATPPGGDEEQALLDSIIRLAARVEQLSLDNSYRFSASRAYFRLVQARIDELREVRIGGFPTVGEFMDRRLTPAMNTCEAINNRQGALAQRIANTNDLLRTRVGIVQERQNRQILQSMDKRAAQQLHLQQAVEGLSVAAISYYVISLLGYAGKAAEKAGLIAHPEVAEGLLVPVVALAVWMGIRKMRRRMHAEIH